MIKLNLIKNRYPDIQKFLNRTEWNKRLIALLCVVVLAPAGFIAGNKIRTAVVSKHTAKSKKKKAAVIKLAKLKEAKPAKPQQERKETTNIGYVFVEISNERLIPKLKLICDETEFVEGKISKVTFKRVIAATFKNRKEAESLFKKLKKIGYMDPWIDHEGDKFMVVAGSYTLEENIRFVFSHLKNMGFSPKIKDVVFNRKLYIYKCLFDQKKKASVIGKLKEIGMIKDGNV